MDKRYTARFLKGLVSTSFGSIVTVGFHFMSIILMTRYVPKIVLGMYFLALAVVQVLKIVSGLGLDLALAKLVSGVDRLLQRETIASTFALRFFSITTIGIVFYALGRFLLPVLEVKLIDYIGITIILFSLTSYRDLFLGLMQGVQQFKEYAVVEVTSAIVRVILLVAFQDRLNLTNLLNIEIISQAVEILLQLFFLRTVLLGIAPRNINRESLHSIWRFSIPLYLNNLLGVIHDRGNVFLIGVFLNPISVAAFEIARKIPDGFMRLFDSFIVVYFPGLSSLFAKGNREDAKRLMNNSLVLLSAGIIFLVLLAYLFANEILLLLFSREYIEVSMAFVLLMLNSWLRAIANTLGYSLVSASYSSAPVKANIVAVTVNIVSGIFLIRMFGYVGAVYSLLLMNLTSQVIYELLLRRVQLVPHLIEYLKPFFFLVVIIGIERLFNTQSYLLRVLLTGLYIVTCWIFIKIVQESIHSTLVYVSTSKFGSQFWHTINRAREDTSHH